METLQLRLLGSPEARLGDAPLVLPSAKAAALLFYLALTRRAHQRGPLAGLLWGGLPEDSARRNLRGALNQLRPALAPYLRADRQTIAFNTQAPHWLDVAVLDAALTNPDPTAQRAAVALYRGDLLDGFQVRDAPEFESWLTLERERLRQNVLAARHTLAEAAEANGDLPAAIANTQALLALDSWREEAHRRLMRLLALAGRRSEALAQYEVCRRLLAQELGVEPAETTIALYEQIRSGRLVPPAGAEAVLAAGQGRAASPSPERPLPPHNLPAQTTPFVGRKEELAQIAGLLAEPGSRLLTLFGPGGIGKTRLALEAARQALPTFADGAWLVALEAIPSPDLVITAIASALGVPLGGRADAHSLVLAYLRERRTLLLLDNFEHLAEGSELLVRLLEAAPGLQLLVTSREALNLYEETVFPVEGLPYPTEAAPATLAGYDAAELFARRARRVHLHFSLQGNEAAVAAICRLLHGMPLGLELAAAWVRSLPCAEIARALAADLDLLTTSLRNVPDRHRSLAAAFEHSWHLLRPAQQQCLRRLSVFHGGFTAVAAHAVAQADRRTLSTLADKALVTLTPAGRYDLHPLIKQYAFERLAGDPAELAECQGRHTAYFAELLAQHAETVKHAAQQESLQQIGLEIDNVRAAWSAAVAAAQTLWLDQMLESLFHFYGKRGMHQEGARQFERAVAALRPAGPTPLLARLLVRQGRLSENISRDFATPSALFEEGLALARQHQLPVECAQALMGLGLLSLVRGDTAEAKACLSESLSISRQAGITWTLANVLIFLAWLANGAGDHPQAEAHAREAAALHRTNGDTVGIAAALTALGKIQGDTGHLAQAEAAYAEALAICRQHGHQVGAGQALTGLYSIGARQGDLEKAAGYARESLEVTRLVGDRLGMAIAHHNLGYVAASGNRHREAVQHYQQALAIYHTIEADPKRVNNTQGQLAESLLALGETPPV